MRMKHQYILAKVTAEWEAKARIHREAARYWEFTLLSANGAEEERAKERYNAEMSQLRYAVSKLHQCAELRSAL